MYLRSIFDFFIYSSLYIAICAVLMVYQTNLLYGMAPSYHFLAFVFAGTVSSYNFHWYLTPPNAAQASPKLRWHISYRSVHLALSVAGLIAAAYFSLYLLEYWYWLLITAVFTFLYTAPKIPHPFFRFLLKIAVAKTLFLALAWMHVTALLPLIISGNVGDDHVVFVLNRFFFIYAICIVFDRRDAEADRQSGIKSLVTELNSKGIDLIFWSTVVVFFSTSALLLIWFDAVTVLILTAPAVVLALLYYPSEKNQTDYLYYFVLDGLMMLSAPLLILYKFAR